MLQLLLVATIFVALFYYLAIKPMSYWKNRGVIQTKKIWIFGDNFRSVFKIESFAEMIWRSYNEMPGVRYFGMYQFTVPTLAIKDPDLIKQICVKEFDHFADHRAFIPENADPLWGKNLFSLTGHRWREMRPILSPSFTGSKMKNMFVLMSECAENFTNFFLKKNQESIDVEMKDIYTRYTNDVIATTAFGVKVDSLEKPTNEFYMMGKEATDFSKFWRRMKFFGYFIMPNILAMFKVHFFEKQIYNFFTELIATNIKTRREQGIVRPDMINLMMEAQQKGFQQKEEIDLVDNGFATVKEFDLGNSDKIVMKELTNLDIAAQAMIFFFAGFDAVSAVMCFMSYELAVNPDIQQRLREEVAETLDKCNGKLTYEVLLKMKYMDMVISETMRKWPNAIAADRICTKPYTIKPTRPNEKPLSLEKGTVIWVPIFGIHRDPDIYPNPERFDPERFNDDNKESINPYTYIPFGVGPRNCIGSRFALLEIKVAMFHILSKFEIVPTSKTVIPLQISKKQLNLNADGGFNLALKRIVK